MIETGTRRLVGVSLKMYFGYGQARRWLATVASAARAKDWAAELDLFVLPDFLSIASASQELRGSGVAFGAQDVFWHDEGPYTGEVSARTLAEAGCRYVAVGHAERRRLFAEDDRISAMKAAAATRNGLIPVICVGERDRVPPPAAAALCRAQLAPVLEAVPSSAEIVIAYEPVWAIGQPAPAAPGHIREVVSRLYQETAARQGTTRVIYGGSAGPGLFGQLEPVLDGLFLGRSAHDTENLRQVIGEVTRAGRRSGRRR